MAPAPVFTGVQPHIDATPGAVDTRVARRRAARSSRQASSTPKIKRPPNSFICFRAAKTHELPNVPAKEISRIASVLWKCVSPEEKAYYKGVAD
ncbi:hypothetical protein EVG20_g11248, partial [Dentipellis fragilis]